MRWLQFPGLQKETERGLLVILGLTVRGLLTFAANCVKARFELWKAQ